MLCGALIINSIKDLVADSSYGIADIIRYIGTGAGILGSLAGIVAIQGERKKVGAVVLSKTPFFFCHLLTIISAKSLYIF